MKLKMKYAAVGFLFVWLSSVTYAQTDTVFNQTPIQYAEFLRLVSKNNLGYAAEKFNLDIAEANIENAKIFPDPELNIGWFDNGQRRMKMGYGFTSEIGTTLELGGKRKARVDLAKSEHELSKYILQDYFRNLRADATLSYLVALQNKFLYTVQLNSYQSIKQLANSDSIRLKLGAIKEIDAIQSKLEAGSMLNNVFESGATWKMSLVNLNVLTGSKQTDTLFTPSGDFSRFDRSFNLELLITEAQNNRADILAALQSKHASLKMLQLAKANRVMDIELHAGVGTASYVTNIVAPTPSFTQVSAGITIPLKFSNKYAGELKTAYYESHQADILYQQTELQIQAEVTQAYYNYLAYKKQVQQFEKGLLSQAAKVLEGKIYSYKRGETTLLEVLNAQRTYNDVRQSYYQTLYSYAAALVELERSAGLWDIIF